MRNRAAHSIGSSDFKLHKNQVSRLLLSAAVLLALLCVPLAAQSAADAAPSASADSAPASSSAAPAQNEAAPAAAAQGGSAQAPVQNQGAQAAGQQGTPAAGQEGTPAAATAARTASPTAARTAATNATGTGAPTAAGTQDNRQPSLYGNMPSLSDLYVQVPTVGGTPARFGSDVFVFGTGNANALPMDLPVGPDYVLGVGDTLSVNMWGGQANRLETTIDRQGQITLPEAGTIMINGMTIGQAQSVIQKALNTQFQNEQVEISLGRLRTIRVYVVGDVQRPGAYDVSSLSTPLSALYAAGGPTAIGSLRILKQYRGEKLVREVDLYDFLIKGIRSDTDRLLPGDVLFVPPAGAQVSLEGMVHHPAVYELNNEKTLSQVLNLAGGFTATASLGQIIVSRVIAHERHTMLSLPLSGDPAEVNRELSGFDVQGGDDVLISPILPINKDAVYLQGHIYRPGTYPYKDGMTINDLVHSYQDVLPEPADHAELIRLVPPDYHPEVTIFSLRDAMIGNDSFRLQPFDTIHIFGRYDVDAPAVSITGDVLRPGNYPLSQGMTVGDLMRMSGGFTRAAYRDVADLSSYEIQNGQRVLVKQVNVEVGKVLDGDKSADVVLKPLDVLNIRRIAGWQDIGASVSVSGEVEHAGGYGISPGERLSSLIKRAGGFRQDAYPFAAVFERVQVRELAEQAREEMIVRLQTIPISMRPTAATTAANSLSPNALQTSLEQQRDQAIAALRARPASGRLVINISTDISKWENTPADIELRAGDTIFIPKRPGFVMVSGEVYNPVAINFAPGKDIEWYLRKAGSTTPYGDKKKIYVLRSDGSIVVHGDSWTDTSFLHTRLRPGDSIFVPERMIGVSPVWQNVISVAQIMASAALPLAIAGAL